MVVPKDFVPYKTFGPKNFLDPKFLSKGRSGPKKHVQKTWVKKKLGSKKNVGPEIGYRNMQSMI